MPSRRISKRWVAGSETNGRLVGVDRQISLNSSQGVILEKEDDALEFILVGLCVTCRLDSHRGQLPDPATETPVEVIWGPFVHRR